MAAVKEPETVWLAVWKDKEADMISCQRFILPSLTDLKLPIETFKSDNDPDNKLPDQVVLNLDISAHASVLRGVLSHVSLFDERRTFYRLTLPAMTKEARQLELTRERMAYLQGQIAFLTPTVATAIDDIKKAQGVLSVGGMKAINDRAATLMADLAKNVGELKDLDVMAARLAVAEKPQLYYRRAYSYHAQDYRPKCGLGWEEDRQDYLCFMIASDENGFVLPRGANGWGAGDGGDAEVCRVEDVMVSTKALTFALGYYNKKRGC